MKILIALAGYFPAQNYGGPPVSIKNFCNVLCGDAECYIVTSNHEKGQTTPLVTTEGWVKKGNAHVRYLSESEFCYKVLDGIVEDLKPDLVYLNSLFDFNRTFNLLRVAYKRNIKVLLAPRGELYPNAFKKKYKKIPYLFLIKKYISAKNVYFQATTLEEFEQIKKRLNISSDRVFYLKNIPSIPQESNTFANKISGEAKIIYFSRIHPIKNLIFALECLKEIKGKVFFDIYGPKENVNYWDKCQSIIDELPDNVVVKYCGVMNHDDVQKTLNNYHLFFLPTQSENYGHVIAEALFSGLPVLISDQTPWTDVNENNAGCALSLDDKVGFNKYLQFIVDMDNERFNSICNDCEKYVLYKTDVAKIKKLYLEALNGKK